MSPISSALTCDVICPLIDLAKVRRVLAIDIEQALHVERCPAQEECDDHCHCNTEVPHGFHTTEQRTDLLVFIRKDLDKMWNVGHCCRNIGYYWTKCAMLDIVVILVIIGQNVERWILLS
jgi:hypothetical protein